MGKKDLSFTILPIAVAKTMDKAGCPLSEQQLSVLHGCLALYQLKIEVDGLDALIENLIKQGG